VRTTVYVAQGVSLALGIFIVLVGSLIFGAALFPASAYETQHLNLGALGDSVDDEQRESPGLHDALGYMTPYALAGR